MFELRVYCYGVLRYTTRGDWEKLQELQSSGYFVEAREALRPRTGSCGDEYNARFMSVNGSNTFVDHDDGMHGMSEDRPGGDFAYSTFSSTFTNRYQA